MIVGVDKDCSRGRIYWSDIVARQILSANYNGTDKQIFIKDGNQLVLLSTYIVSVFLTTHKLRKLSFLLNAFRHHITRGCSR